MVSTATARLAKLLPPAGVQRRYAVATLVDSFGSGLFLTASALFYLRVLGLSPAQIGIGLSVAGAAGLVAPTPLGHLGDRFGCRRVLILLALARGGCFLLFLRVGGFAGFVVLVALIALADSGSRPVRRAYLSKLVTAQERVTITAYNRATFNVGISLGSLAAGVALAVDTVAAYDTVLVVNAASFLVSVGILLAMPGDRPQRRDASGGSRPSSARPPLAFVALAVVFGLLYTHALLFTVGIPLWVARHTDAPHWIIAAVVLLNTVLAVALQVRAARNINTVPEAAGGTRRAGLALLGGCLLCLPTGWVPVPVACAGLLAGCALLTFGELWSSAASWALSYELSPPDRQGYYLGIWSTGAQCAELVGPLAVTALVAEVGAAGWLALGAAFAVLGLVVGPLSRRVPPPAAAEPEPATAESAEPTAEPAT